MGRRSWHKGGEFVPTDHQKRQEAELKRFYSKIEQAKEELGLLAEKKKNLQAEIDRELRSKRLEVEARQKENATLKKDLQTRTSELASKERAFEEKKDSFDQEKEETEERLAQLESSLRAQSQALAEKAKTLEETITSYRSKLSSLIEREKSLSADKIELAEQKRLVEKKTLFNRELESSIERKKGEAEQILSEATSEKEALLETIQKLEALREGVKRDQDELNESELKLQKREEALKKRKATVDTDVQITAALKEKLDEQEAYQNDVERAQSIERRGLDKKIKLIKKLRKGGTI